MGLCEGVAVDECILMQWVRKEEEDFEILFAATAGAGAAEDEDVGGSNDDANGGRHK